MVLQGRRPRQRMEGVPHSQPGQGHIKTTKSFCVLWFHNFLIMHIWTYFIFHFEENFTLIALCSHVFGLSLKSKSFWICHQIFIFTPVASIIMPSSKIWTKVLERSRMGGGKYTAGYLFSKTHQSNSQRHLCRVPQAIHKRPNEHPAYILHAWL